MKIKSTSTQKEKPPAWIEAVHKDLSKIRRDYEKRIIRRLIDVAIH